MATKDLHDYIEAILEQNPFLRKEPRQKELEGYRAPRSVVGSEEEFDYMANIPEAEDARLSLISQIKMMGLEGKQLEIAEYLIYEMDNNGYITINLKEAADMLSVDFDAIEKAISIIQELEPAGIGARDINECLQLQLKKMGKGHSLEYTIVTEFINELAANDINKIAKTLKVNNKKVQDAIKSIMPIIKRGKELKMLRRLCEKNNPKHTSIKPSINIAPPVLAPKKY